MCIRDRFTTMVSAGTGNFLDGTDFEMIEVGDEVPESADFGVRITGDSMEPKYINHQIVWVHQQDYLLHGEIGIFCFNGDASVSYTHLTQAFIK